MQAHERTRTRLDPQIRRTQIVEAAVRVFSETDPVDVTFEEIAEAAGVSRALVYNYFGDRGGLVAAVYLHTFDELNAELNATIDPDAPPEDRLRSIVTGYLRFAVDHAPAWRLLQSTGAVHHPAVHGARQRHMERLALAWGAHGPEGRTLAYGVVGLLESATFDWLRDRDTDMDRLSDLIFDLLWSGLSSLDRHGIALPLHRPANPSPPDPPRPAERLCGFLTWISLQITGRTSRGAQAGGFVPATRQQYQVAIVRYGRKRSPRGSSSFDVGVSGSP